MKKLIPVLLTGLMVALSQPVNAQPFQSLWLPSAKAPVSTTNPLPVTTSGVTPPVVVGSMTNTTANVPNTSTTVTLASASTHLIIKTDPAAAIVYVDLAGGTATSADFRIDPGGALSLDNTAAITTFKILGASATGTYSVAAW